MELSWGGSCRDLKENVVRRRIRSGLLAGILTMATAVLLPVAVGAPTAAQAAGSEAVLTPVLPARLVDSRPGQATVDGQHAGQGSLGAGSSLAFKVTGRGGVPAAVSAVMLNVTAIRPSDAGFLTVYPCGERPNASNVNYTAGSVSPNAVLASVNSSGDVCVYSSATSHVAVDVNGYVPVDGNPVPVTPSRVLDTRPGQSTSDGQGAGAGLVNADTHIEVMLAGRANVPTDAEAAILNVTAVQASDAGFLTVYPCGVDRPLTSSVNYGRGPASPNSVVTKIGTEGKVCIYTSAPTQILVDVNGYVVKDGAPATLTPQRLMDSRPGKPTVDGQASGIGRLGANATYEVRVVNRGGVAADATAVLLNVTAVQPSEAGFITVFPCSQRRPNASHVNYTAGGAYPNAVLAKVGVSGTVCLFTTKPTDLIVDVSGYVVNVENRVVLGPNGVGPVRIGDNPDAAVAAMIGVLGQPTKDSGWEASPEGYPCVAATSRTVRWDDLLLTFAPYDVAARAAAQPQLITVSFRAGGDYDDPQPPSPTSIATERGLRPGYTLDALTRLYPEASISLSDEEGGRNFTIGERFFGTLSDTDPVVVDALYVGRTLCGD